MANIFKEQKDYVPEYPRNKFDLSFSNNLTMDFGKLVPICCKPVFPGDTIDLDIAAALNFMPLKYPVQTPIKLVCDAFYVRSRTLWSGFMDFITGVDDTKVLPYISIANTYDRNAFFGTGSLADYLGCPSTVVGFRYSNFNNYITNIINAYDSPLLGSVHNIDGSTMCCTPMYNTDAIAWSKPTEDTNSDLRNLDDPFLETLPADPSQILYDEEIDRSSHFAGSILIDVKYGDIVRYLDNGVLMHIDMFCPLDKIVHNGIDYVEGNLTDAYVDNEHHNCPVCFAVYSREDNVYKKRYVSSIYTANGLQNYSSNLSKSSVPYHGFAASDGRHFVINDRIIDFNGLGFYADTDIRIMAIYQRFNIHYGQPSAAANMFRDTNLLNVAVTTESNKAAYCAYPSSIAFVDITSTVDYSTLVGGYYDSAKINALPFRAYESIYNSYYRNERVMPLSVDGINVYNRFVSNNNDGADSFPYALKKANWDLDAFTSSVPSPQFGIAPLVGVRGNGTFHFVDNEGNEYDLTPKIAADGNTIVGIEKYDENLPIGSVRMVMDAISNGISINDFRNVNAFQKYLENMMRRGLRYIDVIKSQFGTDMKYKDVDMPEYIGGFTQSVNVNQISQTMETEETPLGAYAGQASVRGKSENHIHHYCDEHGYLMVIARVVPMNQYSQCLPKHFLYRDTLDYANPVFNHVGLQPITYEEISPLQTTFYSDKNLSDTFGYNRVWYDLISSVDEVHGEYRTTLRNFTIGRVYDYSPELGESFITIDSNHLNDIFNVTVGNSKILGSFYFDLQMTRPISKISIPSIN